MSAKTIEQSVNQALDDLPLVENRAFVELMTAMYARLEDADCASCHTYQEIIADIKSAIGEFVPA